jgi:RimJ/RimL family protein N-acetyltransferase
MSALTVGLRELRPSDLAGLEASLAGVALHPDALTARDAATRLLAEGLIGAAVDTPEVVVLGVEAERMAGLVGGVAVRRAGADRRLEFWVHPALQGVGIATAAVAACVAGLRAAEPDVGLVVVVDAEHRAAVRVAEKNGFARTGEGDTMRWEGEA